MAGDGYNGVILSGNGEAIAIINNDGGPFFSQFLVAHRREYRGNGGVNQQPPRDRYDDGSIIWLVAHIGLGPAWLELALTHQGQR